MTDQRIDDSNHNNHGNDENPNSEINNRLVNNVNVTTSDVGCAKTGIHSTSVDEVDEEENLINNIFECDWLTRKSDHVLELLLKRLGGDTSSFLVGYGYPVKYSASCCPLENGIMINADTSATESGKHGKEQNVDEIEATLSCSQHASEILITIIQNSPLDSPFMVSLSSDPILQQIIDLVMPSTSSNGKELEFVAHESIMTCAITVLESLVLQLGGYGAVAATSSGAGNGTQETKTAEPHTMTEYDLALHDHSSSTATSDIANTSTMLRHMTALLARFSELLTHPLAQTWTSLAQYTHGQPRMLLGSSRLRILRLIEALVLLGNPDVDVALEGSNCLEMCLDLFWKFEWCSMLHQSAANMLVHVFEGGVSRSGLQEYFLLRCNLVERLMDSFIEAEEYNIIIVPSSSGDDSSGSIAGDRSEGEKEVVDQFEEDIIIGSPVALQYDKMIRAMKCQNDYGAVGDDGVDAVAPVSEDDVDSAMEQECQEAIGAAFINTSPEEIDAPPELVTDNSSSSTPQGGLPNQTCFRKGYMGHVIIICQALVHACRNSVSQSNDEWEDGSGVSNKPPGVPSFISPEALAETSIASSIETSAININVDHQDADLSWSNTKKRKERSPVRGGAEDIKRRVSSPISESGDDSSASHTLLVIPEVSSSVSQSSPGHETNLPHKQQQSIDSILRHHPLYDKWNIFVTTTLASEMTVQSTPLGGQNNPNISRNNPSSELSPIIPSVLHDNFGGDFLGIDEDGPSPFPASGLYGGHVVGEIDMDENDLDIAASMMEALRVGHNRHRPCFGGEGTLLVLGSDTIGSEKVSRGIANFGSVIPQPGGFHDYVYDDPLGQVRPFENGVSNNEDSNGLSRNNSDDAGFMSDAMVVSRDGGVTKQHCNGHIKKTGSSSSDEVEDDDDDDVPVLDLFAGSFDPNFANFDSFDGTANDTDPFDSAVARDVFSSNGAIHDKDNGTMDEPFQFSDTPLDLVDSLSSDSEYKDPNSWNFRQG